MDTIFRKHVKGATEIPGLDGAFVHGHGGVRDLTDLRVDRTFLFATLRDPWGFYSSLDAHFVRGRGVGFLGKYLGGRRPFSEVLTALMVPERAGVRLNESVHVPGLGVIEAFGQKLSDAGIGFYTWWVLRLFCRMAVEEGRDIQAVLEAGDAPWSIDCIVDTAHLREGLCAVLASWDMEVAARVAPIIEAHPVTNKSRNKGGAHIRGGPDPRVYTSEMQAMVTQADGWLIRRFGFDRPASERPAAVLLPKQVAREAV